MSSANLNTNGTLRCGKLVLAGQTIVPGAITTTVLTGQTGAGASGAVAVSSTVTNNAGPAVPLAFATTGSTMVLTGNIPPGGAGGGTTVPTLWNNASAYAVGAVVSVGSLATPTGTFICITAVPVGAPTNPAPSATPGSWTPVAPLAGGSGVASLAGGGATPTLATGAVAFTSTVASGATTALTWTSSASGMELGGTIETGAQAVPYIVQAGQKSWTATGTTDAITLTALPAGTYIIMLSWGMATAPPALLTAPPPTAGATTVAVVASGSVTAASVYQWSVIRLTLS